MNVNDIYRVRMYCRDNDQVGINVMHYRVTAVAGGGPSDQDIADVFASAGFTLLPPLLNNNAEFRGASVQFIYPGPLGAETFSKNPAFGTAGATSLPRQTSGLLSVRTALGGRKNRGRIYIPFPATADDTGDGLATAGYQSNLLAYWAGIVNPSIGVLGVTCTLMFGVFHRSTNTINDQVARIAYRLWATQRRRGSFGRPNVLPLPLQ